MIKLKFVSLTVNNTNYKAITNLVILDKLFAEFLFVRSLQIYLPRVFKLFCNKRRLKVS